MTQRYKQALMQADLKATFLLLRNAFPDLEKVPLRESVTSSPFLAPLAKRLQLNIPIDAYPSECIALYKQINDDYLRHALNLDTQQRHAANTSDVSFVSGRVNEENQQVQENNKKGSSRPLRKCKINFLELSTFIADFNVQQERNVSMDLIEMGRTFKSWTVDQISTILSPRPVTMKKEAKQESADIKFGRQKTQDVKIVFGKNISLECKIMRHEIINRAQNNKLLSENTQLSDLQKRQIEMNFILNRITEEYFEDFREQLKPYAQNDTYSFILSQKILEKTMEEHNFIKIYSKLVKSLKNQPVAFGSKVVLFRHIFVEKLQEIFYRMVRTAQWQNKEELLKKQLLGLSMFIGELFCNKFLSKNIFPDIFYELLHKYVIEYRANVDSKSFYFQTYIECIVKMIQRMSTHYDQLVKKSNVNNLETVVTEILDINNPVNFNFYHVCDYVEVLKIINARLPSQRFKITFLLQDFRCSKAIKHQLDNSEAEVVKSILAIDINQHHDVQRIPSMIANLDLQIMMKDFFFQFAEGNIKQVNKHIEIYKILSAKPGVTDATIKSFKDNVEGLYLIESDFPYLAEGVAKVMRIVCDLRKMDYYELDLGQDNHPDQDIRQFLQKVEEKYFKMSMQD